MPAGGAGFAGAAVCAAAPAASESIDPSRNAIAGLIRTFNLSGGERATAAQPVLYEGA